MTVLVAYASKHGSTAEIAEAIAAELRERGLGADCLEAGEASDLAGYDAVVLGSAVYMRRWQGDARHFLRKHSKDLADRPFWVFSSGPTGDPAEDDAAWEEPRRTIAKAEKLGARDHVVFGGRISPESGRMAKAMAENTPEEFRDRRDWDEIRAWAAGIAAELNG
jgi:menaquinone-dependent protoporphyrinogen oxidase